MADKEERIFICKTFKTDPCEICEGSGQIECAFCKRKPMFDKSISRAEAVERMAKGIFTAIWGLPNNRFDLAKDSVRRRNLNLAESALDALLGGKK